MNNRFPYLFVPCILAALACAWVATPAEVSAWSLPDHRVRTMLMGDLVSITDGADPIPSVSWEPYSPLSSAQLLNPSGATRPDGRPDVALHPASRWPLVVWAYNNQTDHDIAYAEWTGNGWSAVRFLTFGPADEVDPRVFVDRDGAIHVVWWVRDNQPHVMMTTRGPGFPDWEAPVRVSPLGESAVRPTVAAFQGAVWVAYERDDEGDLTAFRELVVRRRLANGTFVVEHLASAERTGPLDPILHVLGAQLWLDWKYADQQFGFTALQDATWRQTGFLPWLDASWVGAESVRLDIQRLVRNSNNETPTETTPTP